MDRVSQEQRFDIRLLPRSLSHTLHRRCKMLRHMLQSRIVASRVLPPAWTCCSIGITQLSSTSHNSSSSSSSDDGGAADAVSSTPTRKPRGRPRTSTTTATTTAKTATASTTTSTLNAAARPRGRPRSTASDAGVASSKAAARLAAIARQNAPLLIDRDPRNLQDEFVEREEDVPYPSMPLARDIVKRKTIYVHAVRLQRTNERTTWITRSSS